MRPLAPFAPSSIVNMYFSPAARARGDIPAPGKG